MKIQKIKQGHLSTKIAVMICSILSIIFVIFIMVTVITTKNSIEDTSFALLENISDMNGIKIEQITNRAETISQDISFYMQNAMENQMKTQDLLVPGSEESLFYSKIYPNVQFKTFGTKVEDYLINTIQAAIKNTEDIAGGGILFEPYIMNKNQESYALYAGRDGVVKHFGEYKDYSKENFYITAAEKKELAFVGPSEFNGISMITASSPVVINDVVIGVVVVDIDLTTFDKIESTNDKYKSMYTAIIKGDGVIIYESSSLDYIGTSTFEYMNSQKSIDETKSGFDSNQSFYTININSTKDKVYKFYAPIKAGDDYWYSMTSVNVSDVNQTAVFTAWILVAIAVFSLMLLILVIIVVLRRMLKPINEVVSVADCVAQGNLNVMVQEKSNDEIGMLARAFNETIISLKSMIHEISKILNEIADNNLNIEFNADFKGDFIHIKKSVIRIIEDLNGVMNDINITAEQVLGGSEQMSTSAQVLSESATDQAGSVEELAATINEISEQIRKTADNTLEASGKTKEAEKELGVSYNKMNEMVQAMDDINAKSKEISNIIKTIEGIATQTNLLSLNAAIEAARAGEAGKGFAVVADEIRDLAANSAKAAQDIVSLIGDSISAVDNGTKIVKETEESLKRMIGFVKGVTGIVDDIAKAAALQSESVDQISIGIDQISSVVETNSATAEETAAASEELSSQAMILKEKVDRFQLKGDISK